MASCRTVEFFYAAIPLRPFRDLLIRTHSERCEHCRARLVSREEAISLFVGARDTGSIDDLWGRIADRTSGEPETPIRSPAGYRAGLRWATAAVMALVVAAAGFWLLDRIEKTGSVADFATGGDGFRLEYVNIGGAPAQTFVFQPLGSDTVYVWAQRAP